MANLLETKRLLVKEPHLEDLDHWMTLLMDEDVMFHFRTRPKSKEEVFETLQKNIAHQEKHGFSLGTVFEKETGSFVGRSGLIFLAYDDTQPLIERGSALLKQYWSHGYGTELALGFIDWGFQNLDVDRILSITNHQNVRSQKVSERIGMKYVGDILYDGKYPSKRYDILRDDEISGLE